MQYTKGLGLALLSGTFFFSASCCSSCSTQSISVSVSPSTPVICSTKQKIKVKSFTGFAKKMRGKFSAMPFRYKITFALAFFSVFRFCFKRPSNKPARYELSKLNIKNLFKNPKEFFKHMWYFIDDFIIGRAAEGSNMKVKFNKETEKVEAYWDPGAKPQGLGGYLHINILSPIAKAFKFPALLLASLGGFVNGMNDWCDLFEAEEQALTQVNS